MGYQGFRISETKELSELTYMYNKFLVGATPSERRSLEVVIHGFEALLQARRVHVVLYANTPETQRPAAEDVILRIEFFVDADGGTVVESILPPGRRIQKGHSS